MAESANFYQLLELRVVDLNEGTGREPNPVYSFYMMIISKTNGPAKDRRRVWIAEQEFEEMLPASERNGLLFSYQKSMENIGKEELMRNFSSKFVFLFSSFSRSNL